MTVNPETCEHQKYHLNVYVFQGIKATHWVRNVVWRKAPLILQLTLASQDPPFPHNSFSPTPPLSTHQTVVYI